jgi:arabinofuranosyltransferase
MTAIHWISGLRGARLLAFVVVMAVVVKAAWLCDDAFITMRSVDNLLHGRGLTWNPGERVQVFTHPLWLFVLAAADVLSPSGYWAAMLASLAVTAAALLLLLNTVPARATAIAAAAAALALSRAHVDFATSGLENPLACLLIVLALRTDLKVPRTTDDDRRDIVILTLLTSLLALTRLDLVLVTLPALAARLLAGGWRHWRQLAVAAAPLVAWEIFSLVYFGFPLPNTAYAKLGTGIAASDLARRGWWYLEATLRRDPLTIVVIAAGLALVLARGDRARRLWAVGVLLYLAYVVRIGGDFMMGRFLVAPLVAVVALAAALLPGGRRGWLVPAALAAGLLAPRNPVLAPVMPPFETWFRGVADERGYYYPGTGLLARLRPGFVEHEYITAGRQARAIMEKQGEAFQAVECIGFYGYYAGPRIHVIDVMALADPFLARLPVRTPGDPRSWRIGHFERALPPGYRETIAGGRNVIADPALARLYDDVRLVTTGPLSGRERWGAIVRLNLGRDGGP